MKTSVVITTYNGARYIVSQLQSIYEQTIKPDEVLIFDDGSIDETCKIIDRFITEKRLLTWQFFVNKNNKGWRKNFIDGIRKATSDIIFLCDQDDIWLPDKIEKMSGIMKNHQEIDLLVSNWKEITNDVVGENEYPLHSNNKIEKIEKSKNIFFTQYPGCSYCIRKSFVDKTINYWIEPVPHDTLFWRLGILSGVVYRYNHSLFYWRKHIDSTFSKQKQKERSIKGRLQSVNFGFAMLEILERYIKDNNLESTFNKEIVDENKAWLSLRKKFLESKNIFDWFGLIKYQSLYPSNRQIFVDLLSVMLSR